MCEPQKPQTVAKGMGEPPPRSYGYPRIASLTPGYPWSTMRHSTDHRVRAGPRLPWQDSSDTHGLRTATTHRMRAVSGVAETALAGAPEKIRSRLTGSRLTAKSPSVATHRGRAAAQSQRLELRWLLGRRSALAEWLPEVRCLFSLRNPPPSVRPDPLGVDEATESLCIPLARIRVRRRRVGG